MTQSSLLPQRTLEQNVPIGTVQKDGSVRINDNWWLLFYNIAARTLGTTLQADALQALAETDADVADTDAITLRQAIRNLQMRPPDDAPAFPPPDLTRALLLAQDDLLPDPAPAAQPFNFLTVGASPFAFTAPSAGHVLMGGGTLSALTLSRGTGLVAVGEGFVPVCRGDIVTVTYSAAPAMIFIPWSTG